MVINEKIPAPKYISDKATCHEWNKPDMFFIRRSKGSDLVEDGLYSVLYDHSDSTKNELIYERIYKYLLEHNLEICGNTYEEYPLNEIAVNNSEEYLIKISVRVKKR